MKNLSLKICIAIVALLGGTSVVAVSILPQSDLPTRLSGGLFKFDFESDLPKCPEYRHRVKSPWNNCFGTHNYSWSGTYTGEFKNNMKNGFGKMWYVNGDIKAG